MFPHLDCSEGFYGDECENKCGYCINSTKCHHVNGTCMDGCEPGYKGEYCNIGMDNKKDCIF